MPDRLRVLLVEDSPDDAALLIRELRRGGYVVEAQRVETAAAMREALREHWDAVIADYVLPQFSAPAALRLVKEAGLDVPFIIVSGTIGEETAVAAMKAGAHDYLMKGNLKRLVPAIERELREAAERRERGRAEAELARERDYSRTLLEGANALIVGLDRLGRITLFNHAAEVTTGYRREEVLGRSWFDFIVPRERYPHVWHTFERFLATERPGDIENPILTKQGEERMIAWRTTALRSEGEVTGLLSFGVDVTERRRAEEERLALEQLARRAEKLAALGTLAAGLAHELNNPVGIISSRIELMLLEAEQTGLPQQVRDDLEVLHRHAQRVARIAQGLLSFARQSPGTRAPVDLNDIVRETLLLAEKQMTEAGIEIVTALDPALPPVLGDANTLQQVVLNLLTNARDAIEGRGEIRIETRALDEPPGAVRLTVSDTGHGIQAADLARIFDPFFSTKPKGTGLGLSITDGIVREHGGTIDVESRPGQGTRFVLTFPSMVQAR